MLFFFLAKSCFSSSPSKICLVFGFLPSVMSSLCPSKLNHCKFNWKHSVFMVYELWIFMHACVKVMIHIKNAHSLWTCFFCLLFFVLSAGNKYKIDSQREPNVALNLLVKQLVLVPHAYKLARIHQRACVKLSGAACWVILYLASETMFSYSLSQ